MQAVTTWFRALIGNTIWLLRPRLPWPLARLLIARRTRRALTSPAQRALAVDHMTVLLGAVATPEEIAEAARRYTEFGILEAELRWHPRRATAQRVEGVEHVIAARERGRGVVVSFVHHGFFAGMFGAIKRAGVDHVVVVRTDALSWYERPRQRQVFRLFRRGGPLVEASEGVAGLVRRLNEGQTVMIATDVPGASTVMFAGRRVRCSSGAIRAAQATGAPLLTVDAYRTENDHVIRFGPPLYPERFASTQEFLDHVIADHEEAILQWPEATFVPALSWTSATGAPSDPSE